MSEQETLSQVAEAIRKQNRPDIKEVGTFGGGANGLPGVRVDFTDGSKCFLVTALGQVPQPVGAEPR